MSSMIEGYETGKVSVLVAVLSKLNRRLVTFPYTLMSFAKVWIIGAGFSGGEALDGRKTPMHNISKTPAIHAGRFIGTALPRLQMPRRGEKVQENRG
jgi:hypothetical protein